MMKRMRTSILIPLAALLVLTPTLALTPALTPAVEAQSHPDKPDRVSGQPSDRPSVRNVDLQDNSRNNAQNTDRRLSRRERREARARAQEEARNARNTPPNNQRNRRNEEDRQTADLNRQAGARLGAQFSDRLSTDERRRQAGRTLPYLAYTLGELHYLSYACDGLDAQQWRQRMVQLMSMEAPDNGDLRDRMIDNFNEGYRVQQRFRPICGPEVDAERRALAHRGQDLSDMMREAYFD